MAWRLLLWFYWLHKLFGAEWPFFTGWFVTIHEQESSFHLLVSSIISFFSILKFSSQRYFPNLIRFTIRYFLSIINEIVSLISFSLSLPVEYRKAFCILQFRCKSLSILGVFFISEMKSTWPWFDRFFFNLFLYFVFMYCLVDSCIYVYWRHWSVILLSCVFIWHYN